MFVHYLHFSDYCLHFCRHVLNSHSFGYVTGANQRLYPLCHVYEFLGTINLKSSATIFTSAHIVILLLSLHDFFDQSSYCNFVVIIAFLSHYLLLVPILY